MPSRLLLMLLLACSIAVAAVPLVPSYLPLVDFPQHVAQHAIWNNLHNPAFHLSERFWTNLATPYLLPNLVVHILAQVLGAEGALRAVLAIALVSFPLATLVLLKTFERPAELSLAAFPASLSFSYWFGFVPFVIALPLLLLGIALCARCARSGSPRDAAWLAGVGLLIVATHGFAFLILLGIAPLVALVTTRSLRRTILVGCTLLPGFLWSVGWASMSGAQHHAQPLPTAYGSLRERARYLLASMFGEDTRDPRVIVIALAFVVLGLLAVRAARASATKAGSESGRRALIILALASFAAAAVCPQTFMNTWGLWERIPPIAFVLSLGALSWPSAEPARARFAVGLTVIALFASVSAVAKGVAFGKEVSGIRELAQKLPLGQRVMWSACGNETPWAFSLPSLKHLGAYVLAERGGDLSYTFSHFHHMVMRYRGEPLPYLFDKASYDSVVMRIGPRCPPLEKLQTLGPALVEGAYVALPSSSVTAELEKALAPEWLDTTAQR